MLAVIAPLSVDDFEFERQFQEWKLSRSNWRFFYQMSSQNRGDGRREKPWCVALLDADPQQRIIGRYANYDDAIASVNLMNKWFGKTNRRCIVYYNTETDTSNNA